MIRVVVPLVSETHGDSVPSKRPHFLYKPQSNSLAHLRERKAMISLHQLMNSNRFLQRESIAYAKATFAVARVFQASSASRTFCIALSRVNGGNGGRAGVIGVAIIYSPAIDSKLTVRRLAAVSSKK